MILDSVEQLVIELLEEVGELVMGDFGRLSEYSLKSKNDIVTKLDKDAEKIIIDSLNRNFPEHSIFSEEDGLTDRKSKYTWIVDPIDGTINYYSGISPFRIAMALLEDNKPIFSAIYNPVKKDIYTAKKGGGAFKNGRKMQVNDNGDLNNYVVMTHLSSKKNARNKVISSLNQVFSKVLQIRILGSGSASLGYIADGKYDAFYNVKTHPWDILPGSLIVQESGGQVTDVLGKEITIDSTSILASNGKLHKQLVSLIK
jgi:myo-inositol-1(or 4)-monophosphatase